MSKTSKSEKEKILREEKERAINSTGGMEKSASFMGRNYQQAYPTPFLNLSDMQIPESTVEILKWCKYFYTFDPIISGAINALATFPVSEIHLEPNENENSKNQEEDIVLYNRILHKVLDIYKLSIEIGIDYFLFGNCIVFGEMKMNESTNEMEWSRMTRLDPSRVIIDYNPATGQKRYKWQVPPKIKSIVNKRKPLDEYNKIPDVIKEAAKKNQAVVLNPENVYHFSRATDSMGENNVWGTPIVANVLKLLMYRNTLRQAQEAIAREHIVPMRIFYLDKTDSFNTQTNWQKTATDLANEIKKTVADPNYKIVSPVPVNMLNVGGNGRSLLLAPEIEQVHGEILAGMNVPKEFIFGGVSYSGSSISLKILENQFITYRLLLKDFYQNFIIKNMEKARGNWLSDKDDEGLLSVRLTDLKMQDDVQQKQLIVQLNSAGKCSNDLMWQTMGIDAEKMKKAIETEALEAIELQTKTQIAQLEAQIKMMPLQNKLQTMQTQMQMQMQSMQMQQQMEMQGAQEQQAMQAQQQQAPASEGQAQEAQEGQEAGSEEQINKIALQLIKLPDADRQNYLNQIPPSVKTVVQARIQELEAAKGGAKQGKEQGVDMRPMPSQRPPRRESLK